ncbi:MAG: hypothetical protein P8Y54_03065 [Xanthomonadales bacterium]
MNSNWTERDLLERMARLPREIRPPHDPWLKIAARLDEPAVADSRAPAPGWALRAVAALAVAALALGVVFSTPDRAGPDPERLAAAPPLIVGSEAEYRAAFREFLPLGEARVALSSGTVATIENSWSALVSAERDLQAALNKNPDNRFLNQKMLELRSRQLGFLRQLAGLEHSNRRLSI